MSVDVSLIIPALNEEGKLGAFLAELIKALEHDAPEIRFELIVVDDGSTDRTWEEIQSIRKLFPAVSMIVIQNITNLGVGSSFLKGVSKSTSDFLTLVPGDGAFEPMSVVKLCKSSNLSQMTLSYRETKPHYSVARKVCSKALSLWFSFITKEKVIDAHSLFLLPTNIAIDFAKTYPALDDTLKVDGSYHLKLLYFATKRVKVGRTIPVRIADLSSSSTAWNARFFLKLCALCLSISSTELVARFQDLSQLPAE